MSWKIPRRKLPEGALWRVPNTPPNVMLGSVMTLKTNSMYVQLGLQPAVFSYDLNSNSHLRGHFTQVPCNGECKPSCCLG